MDAGQKTESLFSLVEDIDKGAVVLPEFQRDFVWEIEKTVDLFDSFVREIFVGSLIYGRPSFEIAVREIDARPRTGQGSRKKLKPFALSKEELDRQVQTKGLRLLLDGQQRTTSVYRALKGIDPLYFVIKEQVVHCASDMDALGALTIDEMLSEFSAAPPEGCLCVAINDVYRLLTGNLIREKDQIEQMRKSNTQLCSQIDDLENSSEAAAYLSCLRKLYNLFRRETLLSYYLLETDAERFALFFERSNSKGVQLNFIDILSAKLWVGFKLREQIDLIAEKHPGSRLSHEAIVRALSYIVSDGKQIGRSFILNNLTHQHFSEHWTTLVDLFVKAEEYLRQQKLLLNADFLPYENLLIPLALFIRQFKRFDLSLMSEQQRVVLHSWYWLCIFSRRYSQAALSSIVEDTTFLIEVSENRYKRVAAMFRQLMPKISDAEDIIAIRRYNDATYRGIQNLIYHHSKGLRSLYNEANVALHSELEDHHIFPKDYLRSSLGEEFDLSLCDSIANKMLIPKLSNLRISNKAPSKYLREIKEGNPYLANSTAAHLLPATLLLGAFDNDFERFLSERATMILDLIREVVMEPAEKQIRYFSTLNEIS